MESRFELHGLIHLESKIGSVENADTHPDAVHCKDCGLTIDDSTYDDNHGFCDACAEE